MENCWDLESAIEERERLMSRGHERRDYSGLAQKPNIFPRNLDGLAKPRSGGENPMLLTMGGLVYFVVDVMVCFS